MYHILLSGDEKYLKFIAVCMHSIVLHTDKSKNFNDFIGFNQEIHDSDYIPRPYDLENHEEKYVFHVLTDGILDSTREKFVKLQEELTKIFPTEIKIHVIPVTEFIGCKMWQNSYLAYYRLVMNRLLPSIAKKALYLDGSDTLAGGDLRELFTLDLEDTFAAVAQNAGNTPFIGNAKKANYNDVKKLYFNSGVMLVNLVEWRKHNMEERTLDYVKKHDLAFVDQDALNILFDFNVIGIPHTWNMMINKSDPQKEPIKHPKIAHFAFKPWKSSSTNSFWVSAKGGYYYPDIDTWWQIAEQTPYFKDDIKTYTQSNSYQKKVKRQAKLERVFANAPSLEFSLYTLNKKLLPYLNKIEGFFKNYRTKYRNWKLRQQ